MNNQKVSGFLQKYALTIFFALGAIFFIYLGVADIYDRVAAAANDARLIELEKNLAIQRKIAEDALKHEAAAKVENDLLRAAGEARAKSLRESQNRQARQEEAQIAEIESKFQKRLQAVQDTPDADQFKELCADAQRVGMKLILCEAKK